VESLRLRRKHLVDLSLDVEQTAQTREPNRFRELKRKFGGAGLTTSEWDAFKMAFAGDVTGIVDKAISKLDGAIMLATEGDLQNPLDPEKTPLSLLPLNQLRTLRDASKICRHRYL
jgi:hypothetical protein